MSEQNRPVFQSVEAVQAQFAQWNYIADRALALEIDELRAETLEDTAGVIYTAGVILKYHDDIERLHTIGAETILKGGTE